MQLSQSITRKSASNLALAFVLLPKPKRMGMAALYAFCRAVDDISDDEESSVEERRTLLGCWRKEVRLACDRSPPSFPIVQELQPAILRHNLPFELFDQLLQGVEMDLEIKRYSTYSELEQYCYRVASVVGLLSIEIFGYQDPGCRDYAVLLGQALQLTNILRDVRNDAERGRIYLPTEELERHGVEPAEILRFEYSDRFYNLARAVAHRARNFYLQARQALPVVDRPAMASGELMGSVYWRLLEKLERNRFQVFDASLTRLSKPQKLFLVARTWYRTWTGAAAPNYGV